MHCEADPTYWSCTCTAFWNTDAVIKCDTKSTYTPVVFFPRTLFEWAFPFIKHWYWARENNAVHRSNAYFVQLLRALLRSQTHHKQESSVSIVLSIIGIVIRTVVVILILFAVIRIPVADEDYNCSDYTSIKVPATNTKPTWAFLDQAVKWNHQTATVTPISASITDTLVPAISTKRTLDIQTCLLVVVLDRTMTTVTVTYCYSIIPNTYTMVLIKIHTIRR